MPKWQYLVMANDLDRALTAVGPRLRALRQRREMTLADLSAATDISVSTLSRLESGSGGQTWSCYCPSPKPTASRSMS